MRARDGAVDHLEPVGRWIDVAHPLVQRLQDGLPQPGERRAPEPAIGRGPLPKLIRQVTPGAAGARDPEHPIQHPAVVAGKPPLRRPHRARGAARRTPTRHPTSNRAIATSLPTRQGITHQQTAEAFCQHGLRRDARGPARGGCVRDPHPADAGGGAGGGSHARARPDLRALIRASISQRARTRHRFPLRQGRGSP